MVIPLLASSFCAKSLKISLLGLGSTQAVTFSVVANVALETVCKSRTSSSSALEITSIVFPT